MNATNHDRTYKNLAQILTTAGLVLAPLAMAGCEPLATGQLPALSSIFTPGDAPVDLPEKPAAQSKLSANHNETFLAHSAA